MMDTKAISNVVVLSKKAIGLLSVLDFEDEAALERKAIAEEFGDSDEPWTDEVQDTETWHEFRETWAQLVKSCGGNKAFAAEVVGRDLDDVEYYL